MFEALLLNISHGRAQTCLRRLTVPDLPDQGDTLVRVRYSSLNYKDALAVSGKGQVVRAQMPFIPGIDLAGEIVETESESFRPGDLVIATGAGLGETLWGGYSELQRVSSQWLVRCPDRLSLRQSMIIGTAGFTAMLSVMAIEHSGTRPSDGPIAVTGASGGVGSLATMLLSRTGYTVTAFTGKSQSHEYLRSLGASKVMDRQTLASGARKPMDTARWAGAVDSVGGAVLEALISQTGRHGNIAVCGLAGSDQLRTTVYPMILRGVSLLGIDSTTCPLHLRQEAWQRLAETVEYSQLEELTTTISLAQISERAFKMLEGKLTGRTLVDLGTPLAKE